MKDGRNVRGLILSDFYPLKPIRITKHDALLQIISTYRLATLIPGSRCAERRNTNWLRRHLQRGRP